MNSKPYSHLVSLTFATLTAGIFCMPCAQAATTAYKIGSTDWAASGGSFVVGFEFSISTSVSITHTGIADWYNNGISGTPQVGVFADFPPWMEKAPDLREISP